MSEKMNEEIVLELLNTIQDDCKYQIEALNSRGDVSWDCYQPENWQSMIDNIEKIKGLLCLRK